MNLIIGLLLSLAILSGIGVAYSQTDTIPTWIKGVAGFWAEDKITDSEFIEALEFLIESNIIQVDDSQKIQELEKENTKLKQKIESLESKETKNKTTVEPQTPLDGLKSYVETDKTEYTLGDTIHLTGLKIIPEPSYGLDGSIITKIESLTIQLTNNPYSSKVDEIRCKNLVEDDNYGFKTGEYTYPRDGTYHKCDINDDGTFTFIFVVMNHYEAGIYYITMAHSESSPWKNLGGAKSQPFTIQ